MSKIWFTVVLIALCLYLVNAASVGRSATLLDANTIIQKIIAEYEKLGGTSKHYPEEHGTYIDPNNLHIHF